MSTFDIIVVIELGVIALAYLVGLFRGYPHP